MIRFLYFLIPLLLFAGDPAFSQVNPKEIPDGTEGETHLISVADTVYIKRETLLKDWNNFENETSTLKIQVVLLNDFATFVQDDAAKQQMDSAGIVLEGGFKVRDFRRNEWSIENESFNFLEGRRNV